MIFLNHESNLLDFENNSIKFSENSLNKLFFVCFTDSELVKLFSVFLFVVQDSLNKLFFVCFTDRFGTHSISCSVCVLQTDSDAADSADHAAHAGERAVQEPEPRPAEADRHAVTAETGPPTRHDAPHAVPLQTLPQVRRRIQTLVSWSHFNGRFLEVEIRKSCPSL